MYRVNIVGTIIDRLSYMGRYASLLLDAVVVDATRTREYDRKTNNAKYSCVCLWDFITLKIETPSLIRNERVDSANKQL